MSVRVTTAAQAAARDTAAIAAGTPSAELMRRAGEGAAAEILRRYPDRLADGVLVLAGTGNNGGDAWIVARALSSAGAGVRVLSAGRPKSPEAIAACEAVSAELLSRELTGDERLVVDGLLGTGATGALRGDIALLARVANDFRARGATAVALDIPSGIDATTGERASGAVVADCTITFGTVKRGLLLERDAAGAIVVIDIGLDEHGESEDGSPVLVDDAFVAERIPPIAASAHKGDRGRLAIVGGARGMAGAIVLAARAALRSGAGLVHAVVDDESVAVLQSAVPAATVASWHQHLEHHRSIDGALVGPGLSTEPGARRILDSLLTEGVLPLVMDADALNIFAGDADGLRDRLSARGKSGLAILTPHPLELTRLLTARRASSGGVSERIRDHRFEVAGEAAERLGAVVVLKGVPTVIADPQGRTLVVARGTPALATGGSGDVLGGIIATLRMQGLAPIDAAGCGAWIHGRAAEIATVMQGGVRGTTIEDVIERLPLAWRVDAHRSDVILATLPAAATGR